MIIFNLQQYFEGRRVLVWKLFSFRINNIISLFSDFLFFFLFMGPVEARSSGRVSSQCKALKGQCRGDCTATEDHTAAPRGTLGRPAVKAAALMVGVAAGCTHRAEPTFLLNYCQNVSPQSFLLAQMFILVKDIVAYLLVMFPLIPCSLSFVCTSAVDLPHYLGLFSDAPCHHSGFSYMGDGSGSKGTH